MFATLRLTEGLLVAHFILAASFLVGSAAIPLSNDRSPRAGDTLLYALLSTASGFALLGFATFGLGLLHAINPLGVTVAYLSIFSGCALVRGESPLNGLFWAKRAYLLAKALDGGSLLLYFFVLILSTHAIVLNYGGSDPVAYHLAYAADWAREGGLSVDPFLRTPFYASNFVLLFTVIMAFGGALYVNFLTWAMGLLAAMTIYAASRDALRERIPTIYATSAAFCLAIAVLLAPFFYRWNDSGYIDVAIGTFAMLATVALWLAVRETNTSWLWFAAICAAFFVGIKASFIVFFPIYLAGIVIAARACHLSKRSLLALIMLFIAFSSPWYARNFILAGDPTPPVFNISLHGHDAFVTSGEFKFYAADLHTARGAIDFATLPWRAFAHPLSHDFREYGTTALMLLIFMPALSAFILFVRSGRIGADVFIVTGIFTLIVLYWFATSTLLRYALVLYSLLPIALSISTMALLPKQMQGRTATRAGMIVAACSVLALIPSPGSAQFFRERYNSDYRFLFSSYTNDELYLTKFSPGYAESQQTISLLREEKRNGRVYVVGDSLNYYFRQTGMVSIGDWSGPAGFFRMYHALEADQLSDFLSDLQVSAVLVDPRKVIGGLYEPLREQLTDDRYCESRLQNSDWKLFIHRANGCSP